MGDKLRVELQHLNVIEQNIQTVGASEAGRENADSDGITSDDGDDGDTIAGIKDELLGLVKTEEDLLQENLRVISSLQVHPGNINVNIKYNIVAATATPATNTTTGDSLQLAMESILEKPSSSPVTEQDPLLQLIDNAVEELPTNNIYQQQTTLAPATRGRDIETAVFAGSSSQLPIVTAKEDKDVYTPGNPDPDGSLYVSTTSTPARTLSPADYLRLCFTLGQGCDFKFGAGGVATSTEPNTTPQPTTTTTTAVVKRQPDNKKMKEKLRQRLRLCFFSRICDGQDPARDDDDDDNQDDAADNESAQVRRPKTIKSNQFVSRLQNSIQHLDRRQRIKNNIRARARACLFEGRCS